MRPRELASRREIRAYSFPGHIVIAAEGEVPESCYRIDVEQLVDPGDRKTEYRLLQSRPPGICLPVVTPYSYSEAFGIRAAEPPTEVSVQHADGTDEVRVEPLGDETGATEGEFIGFSRRLSFDEAFADAVSKAPKATHPDEQVDLVVTETGANFGGIAGFHHLYVKLRRS
jgi:hypothetical protein